MELPTNGEKKETSRMRRSGHIRSVPVCRSSGLPLGGARWKTELCNKDVSNRKGRKKTEKSSGKSRGAVGITLHFACAALRNKVSSNERRATLAAYPGRTAGIVGSVRLSVGGFISADFSLAARPFVTVVFLFQNIVTSGV